MLMWVFSAIGLLVGGSILGGMVGGLRVRAQKRGFENGHPGWEAFVSPYDGNMVAISPDGRDVALGWGGDPVLYSAARILSVEILRDDGMVLTSNPLSQIGSGLVGAAAFGRMGAILGASVASMSVSGTVKNLVLKVVMDDSARPISRIAFFKSFSKSGAKDSNPLLQAGSDLIERFHARLLIGKHAGTPVTQSFQVGSTTINIFRGTA